MSGAVGLVVEGHGEVAAVPILIRRILSDLGADHVQVLHPHRVPRSKLGKGEWGRAIRLQFAKALESGPDGACVLAIMDADDDDPEAIAQMVFDEVPNLGDGQVDVVVAVREYEAWFLASLKSIRGHGAVRSDAEFPGNPERPRNAKKALEEQMTQSYSETLHQASFSQLIDLQACSAGSPSFAELVTSLASRFGGGASPPNPTKG